MTLTIDAPDFFAGGIFTVTLVAINETGAYMTALANGGSLITSHHWKVSMENECVPVFEEEDENDSL